MSKPKAKRKAEPADGSPGADSSTVGIVMPDDALQPAEADPALDAAAGPGPAAARLELEAGLEIKDVEAVHRRLTAAFAGASALTVDLSRVAAIDTAGVQLLLALQRSAGRDQRPLTFTGGSAVLTHALGVLGLEHALTATASGG